MTEIKVNVVEFNPHSNEEETHEISITLDDMGMILSQYAPEYLFDGFMEFFGLDDPQVEMSFLSEKDKETFLNAAAETFNNIIETSWMPVYTSLVGKSKIL
jgi:hypothetical protein